ncbi:MAG TPA: hypothetical protein VK474_03930 [Chthoniobacterales bacterium]|nr:hypothetical protein [Chthoniobacterales bacterium]
MARNPKTLDEPEPRWQALFALLAVGGINLALPSWLSFAPRWVFPGLVLFLLIPSVVSHHTGRFHLNHVLGILISGVITIALIGSVILLVGGLAMNKEKGMALLISGGELWLSNVLVFALWYWRLDGGGPNERDAQRQFGTRSFVFPQMQIEKSERGRFGITEQWRPRFVDYLFIAMMQSSTFGPTDAPVLARWAKVLTMIQVLISLVLVVLLISHAVGAI